jgi:hypothetical protein
VLQTFFPDLRAKHDLLLKVLRKCRSFVLREASTGAHEMGEYFCAQSMLALSEGSRQKAFVSFLPWAPGLMPFLQENIGRIRRPGNLWPIADEAIAQRWNTTRAIVNGTRKSRVRTISPLEMRHLIQTVRKVVPLDDGAASPRQHGRRGRHPEPEKSKAYFTIGTEVEKEILAHLKTDRYSIIAARRLVSNKTRLSYDAVAQYHGAYRRWMSRTKNPL